MGSREVAVVEEPSAVLLVRVWLEGGEGAFRARLSGIGSATPEETTVAVAASPRDVVVAVERWLADFVRDGGVQPGP
jgi:hypothetical protein